MSIIKILFFALFSNAFALNFYEILKNDKNFKEAKSPLTTLSKNYINTQEVTAYIYYEFYFNAKNCNGQPTSFSGVTSSSCIKNNQYETYKSFKFIVSDSECTDIKVSYYSDSTCDTLVKTEEFVEDNLCQPYSTDMRTKFKCTTNNPPFEYSTQNTRYFQDNNCTQSNYQFNAYVTDLCFVNGKYGYKITCSDNFSTTYTYYDTECKNLYFKDTAESICLYTGYQSVQSLLNLYDEPKSHLRTADIGVQDIDPYIFPVNYGYYYKFCEPYTTSASFSASQVISGITYSDYSSLKTTNDQVIQNAISKTLLPSTTVTSFSSYSVSKGPKTSGSMSLLAETNSINVNFEVQFSTTKLLNSVKSDYSLDVSSGTFTTILNTEAKNTPNSSASLQTASSNSVVFKDPVINDDDNDDISNGKNDFFGSDGVIAFITIASIVILGLIIFIWYVLFNAKLPMSSKSNSTELQKQEDRN